MTTPDPHALAAARAILRAAEGPLRMSLRPDPSAPDNAARCAWHCAACTCPELGGGLSIVRLAADPIPCRLLKASTATPVQLAACRAASDRLKAGAWA